MGEAAGRIAAVGSNIGRWMCVSLIGVEDAPQ